MQTGKLISGVELGRAGLGIYAHRTPIKRGDKNVGAIDMGIGFGKEFVERAKQRFGVDLAVHWFDGTDFKKLSSTFGDDVVASQDELKSVLNGTALRREASFRRPFRRHLCRTDQELRRPAGRGDGSHQGHHRI